MLLLTLLLALPSFSVRLVSLDPVRLERWDLDTIPYHLQRAGSDDVGEAALTAVRNAFATWAAIPCANLAFEDLGDAGSPRDNIGAGGRPNGKNEIHWIEDDAWRFGAYVLGVTAPILAPDGTLLEADIAFNGRQVQWTTSGNGGTDLETVALHEIGHFIGLQHNLGPFSHEDPPVMAPYVSSGVGGRTPTDDDRRAACFLYPRQPYTCAADQDCPQLLSQTFESDDFYSGRLTCQAGQCSGLERYVPAAVGLGESCHRPEECRAGLTCHPISAGNLCTETCDPAAPTCAAGYRCTAFAPPLDRYGACEPVDGAIFSPGEGPEGCLDAWICSAGRFCMPTPLDPSRRRCAALCTATDPTCPDGLACHVYAASGGACFPPELLPAPPEPDPMPEPDAELDTATEAEVAEPASPDAEAERAEVVAPRGGGCAPGAPPYSLALIGAVAGAFITARRFLNTPRLR